MQKLNSTYHAAKHVCKLPKKGLQYLLKSTILVESCTQKIAQIVISTSFQHENDDDKNSEIIFFVFQNISSMNKFNFFVSGKCEIRNYIFKKYYIDKTETVVKCVIRA